VAGWCWSNYCAATGARVNCVRLCIALNLSPETIVRQATPRVPLPSTPSCPPAASIAPATTKTKKKHHYYFPGSRSSRTRSFGPSSHSALHRDAHLASSFVCHRHAASI